MIDWYNTKFEERLLIWKDFREELRDMDDDTKMSSVANFFSKVPYGKRSIDYYTPESWPSPWELMDRNTHCLNTVSLMIKYTLKFIGIESSLVLIDDGQECYILPVIDGEMVLNYDHGRVCHLSDHPEIKIVQQIS